MSSSSGSALSNDGSGSVAGSRMNSDKSIGDGSTTFGSSSCGGWSSGFVHLSTAAKNRLAWQISGQGISKRARQKDVESDAYARAEENGTDLELGMMEVWYGELY